MPVDLRSRLDRVYDDATKVRVMQVKVPAPGQWRPPPSGRRIADVRAIVVHETSGDPARHGVAKAVAEYTTGHGEYTQFFVAGDGTVSEVIDALDTAQPLATGHANFVNSWSVGSETGHSWGNYRGNDHNGPYEASHDANGNVLYDSAGNQQGIVARPNHGGWRPLSGDATNQEDLAGSGIKMWIQQFSNPDEMAVSWWTTATYQGPWRSKQLYPEMLFSEWQYRSWAALVRFLCERLLVPRNFPVLPHKMRSGGYAARGGSGHGMESDGASFGTILRADEVLQHHGSDFGVPNLLDQDAVRTAYASHVVHTPSFVDANGKVHGAFDSNSLWRVIFDHYRGIHGHGFSGDQPTSGHRGGDDHDCPGPLFDFHRLAREVWDWWWQPFDFNPGPPADPHPAGSRTDTARRPYRDWNGDTRLREYYYDSPAPPSYRGREVVGIHGPTGSPRTYRLDQGSPVYALATGELVAARFPAETADVSLAFTLLRHDVYHVADVFQALDPGWREMLGLDPLPPTWTPSTSRISYDLAPTSVFSLYMHLGRHGDMSFDQVSAGNPDWLNRLLMRLKECELGTSFRAQAPPHQPEPAVWNSVPPGIGRRSVPSSWRTDGARLRDVLERLRRGDIAVKPWVPSTTPIKVLLGDYLGDSGVINRTGSQFGVRIEVFSRNPISADFALTDSTAADRWRPPAGVVRAAVRYPSEWSPKPGAAEAAAFEAAGIDALLLPWLDLVAWSTRVGQIYPADARFNGSDPLVHYDPQDFMAWINQRTWASEWPKYRITDTTGLAPLPGRPVGRSG